VRRTWSRQVPDRERSAPGRSEKAKGASRRPSWHQSLSRRQADSRTSCGTCPHGRRCRRSSVCRCRTGGSSSRPRPAGPRERRTRLEAVAASAGDGDQLVLGVDVRLHGSLPPRRPRRGSWKKGAQSSELCVPAQVGAAKRAMPGAAAPFAPAQRAVRKAKWQKSCGFFPYPQNLWITLWTARRPGIRTADKIA